MDLCHFFIQYFTEMSNPAHLSGGVAQPGIENCFIFVNVTVSQQLNEGRKEGRKLLEAKNGMMIPAEKYVALILFALTKLIS